jgi:hypothetical protein
MHSVETVLLSHVDWARHAAASWLPDENEEQDAKEDDDERERAEHEVRLPIAERSVKWDRMP